MPDISQEENTRSKDLTTFIAGFRTEGKRETEIEIKDLQPGEYYLGAEIDWNGTLLGEDKQVSISCYGPQKIKFK